MNYIEITTPENINIKYRLAGLGSRMAATFIDLLIQGIITAILTFIGLLILDQSTRLEVGLEDWVIALYIIILFIIYFGYFLLFEQAMNGQTPGKKIFGLRIIRNNGQPIGFQHSLIRNLFRYFIDYWGIGMILILFSKQCKRIGDIAASTIVVAEEKEDIPVLFHQNKQEIYQGINDYPLTEEEYRLVKEYFRTKENLMDEGKYLIEKLGTYFAHKFDIEQPEYEALLEEIGKQNNII